MREIVLDTETTGLEPAAGHRIVEIGAVELDNHVTTGRFVHFYINPERDIPEEAIAIHGLSYRFLSDKPRFSEIADDLLEFIGDAPLIIHNARFDIKFIDSELTRCERPILGMSRAIDTLDLCRQRFPGAASSLDALCRRFGVDNAARSKHGALLDSELLAEVYLELIGGRQPKLVLDVCSGSKTIIVEPDWIAPARPRPLETRISRAEERNHAILVSDLGAGAIWNTAAR